MQIHDYNYGHSIYIYIYNIHTLHITHNVQYISYIKKVHFIIHLHEDSMTLKKKKKQFHWSETIGNVMGTSFTLKYKNKNYENFLSPRTILDHEFLRTE